MNLLALPAFFMDPAAATATIPGPAGPVESDGSQAANNEFLEMLLASEAAFQGTVPVEPRLLPATEASTEVLEALPVVATAPALIPASVEPVSPTIDDEQDQAATAYAMVATLEAPSDAEVASPESLTRATATLVAKADRESSEEESEEIEQLSVASEIEQLSVASSSLERLDAVSIPTAIPIPVSTPVDVPHDNKEIVAERADVSEIKFGRPTPLSNAVSSASSEAPVRPPNDAPVILEALVTPKSAGTDVAPSNEPLPPQVVDQPSRQTVASELSPAAELEPRPASFEATSQRNAESSNKDDHPESASQENSFSNDKAMPFLNAAVTMSSAAKSERPATTEAPRAHAPAIDEKHLQTERTPLKQMDVRIPDSNGDVTVRLQERAGSLHVSVRSSDSQIASGVANALPELTRALETEGFRSETWTPQINPGSDHRLDDAVGATAFSRSEAPGVLQTEQSQTDDAHGERQSEPDWKEQQDKRRKRQTEEEFKENLW